MRVRLHRIATASPDDVSGLHALAASGAIDPARIVAILGKTEGNGCVNDFTRGFAADAWARAIAALTGRSVEAVARAVVLVMSGGTEGGLSPHCLAFEVVPDGDPTPGRKALALGTAKTRAFEADEIGRAAQIDATAEAVGRAMQAARIDTADDVHFVQVKCPLLTKARAAAARTPVVTADTLKSMAYSRGASALGIAVALGEVERAAIGDDSVCRALDLFSSRASASAGVELVENQVLVLGNSACWGGDLAIAHGVMRDAIDVGSAAGVLASLGLEARLPVGEGVRGRIRAVLAKAEASQSGEIRGARHTMLDDSDIAATRHARALVGGALAGLFGTTMLYVSGGAEHQGPDGGGPIAVIAES